jgi:beta-RFAP synthase
MVEHPGLALEIAEHNSDVIEGPWRDRILAVLTTIRRQLAASVSHLPPVKVDLERTAPLHVGLGTGTQLALSVAAGYAALLKHEISETLSAEDLARWTGRGQRSAIGLHGFLRGGLLMDGGKPSGDREGSVAPLISRLPFPTEWAILLAIPETEKGAYGDWERQAFDKLLPVSEEFLNRQCRRLVFEILPAVAEQNYVAFAEALHAYNRDAGQPFRHVQSGLYNGAPVAERVHAFRSLGVEAVGQTSWGPTVFAIVPDAEHACWLRNRLADDSAFVHCRLIVTHARNQAACLSRS